MPVILIFILGMAAGAAVIGVVAWASVHSRENEEKSTPEPHPTKYQTEPPTLAMEIHRGRHAVILKTRNDRTVVREEDLHPLADELRKYHTTVSTLNEVLDLNGVKAEETTQNDPPDPNARSALPERVEVKDDGIDRSAGGSINNTIPNYSYESTRDSMTNLYDLLRGSSSVSPPMNFADYIYRNHPNLYPEDLDPPGGQYDNMSQHMYVTQLIRQRSPVLSYEQAGNMAEHYIKWCDKQGKDPVEGILGGGH